MHIFSRSVFLVDAIEGQIDIHNHLLPGIDDGSPDIQTTMQMIDAYRSLGYRGAITTPHTMEDYYGNDRSSITECFENTKNTLPAGYQSFLRSTASEYMLDAGFSKILESENYLKLKSNYLLFEFSYFQQPVEAEQLIFEMQHHDLKPILAHPERYRYLEFAEILNYKQRGCALQINLLSLSGHYGKNAKKKAEGLIAAGEVDFIATDAHKVAHLEKIQNMKVSKKLYAQLQKVALQTLECFA
jgi:protein-tyrosine phosphatase